MVYVSDVAASAPAVSQLSAKMILLCSQCAQDVDHAERETPHNIEQVSAIVVDLKIILEDLEDLPEIRREEVVTTKELRIALDSSRAQLDHLHDIV
ncbi:hypothetical protein GGR50DRAFT_480931 [Xylaria sp. CBS 124048]|nr:hypothetical protein GGR50DRAFT_480931 [Xylaria sp. CBS 124048]